MTLEIHDYIQPGRTAHLVGIGGVSMSPLAEVLHGAGVAHHRLRRPRERRGGATCGRWASR